MAVRKSLENDSSFNAQMSKQFSNTVNDITKTICYTKPVYHENWYTSKKNKMKRAYYKYLNDPGYPVMDILDTMDIEFD